MGNCLTLRHGNTIKIMAMNGKILKYRSPLRVHQALSEFPGHTISESLAVVRHLDPDTIMLSGQVYHLLIPWKKPTMVEEAGDSGTRVVRIKVLMSVQELKEMITSKGGVSLDAMLSQIQRAPRKEDGGGGVEARWCKGWRPALECIPEGNDISS